MLYSYIYTHQKSAQISCWYPHIGLCLEMNQAPKNFLESSTFHIRLQSLLFSLSSAVFKVWTHCGPMCQTQTHWISISKDGSIFNSYVTNYQRVS